MNIEELALKYQLAKACGDDSKQRKDFNDAIFDYFEIIEFLIEQNNDFKFAISKVNYDDFEIIESMKESGNLNKKQSNVLSKVCTMLNDFEEITADSLGN